MIKMLHHTRCRVSRSGLELLKSSGKEYEIVNYFEDNLTTDELKNILKLLKIKPIDLVRKNEPIWKTDFKNKKLTDQEIIEALVKHPKLIERPIVINGNQAVIGRPPEKILDII